MQILEHHRSRVTFAGRVTMWVAIGIFVAAGLFYSVPAWAETTTCTGNSSIPVTPIVLFLRYGGPASQYEVALCGDPAPGDQVTFTTSVTPANRVAINPTNFVLDDTDPQAVSVSVLNSHPRANPFTAQIVHTASSANPGFNGPVRVTAYYSPPAALLDIGIGPLGQPLNIAVKLNDVDRLGQGLTLPANAIVRQPFRGTAALNANQTLRYTPNNNAPRVDAFVYRVNDAIGNTDNAIVVVILAPFNVRNPQAFAIDPLVGSLINFVTDEGEASFEVPKLNGVDADSDVYCLFGNVASASGNIDSPPVLHTKYTGLSFYFQCYVNGEPVSEDVLAEPANLIVPLPDDYRANHLTPDQLLVANADGNGWRTSGIENVSGFRSEVLQITTTTFGEFSVFDSNQSFFPFLRDAE